MCLADRTFSNHAQNLKVERKIPLFVYCVKAVVLLREREREREREGGRWWGRGGVNVCENVCVCVCVCVNE